MGGTVAPHMCVPEIPLVRVTAQAWNDASKYGLLRAVLLLGEREPDLTE